MTHRTCLHSLLLAALFLGSQGCNSSEPIGRATAALHKAASCAELETMLKQDALLQMNATIDQQIRAIERYDSGLDGFDVFGGGEMSGSEDWGAGGAGGATTGGPRTDETSAGPPAHSETNTQVDGVDEADIVKTDGNYIYLAHGGGFFILNAWPASELAIGASVPIEGQPLELYVAGDKAVVYSLVPAEPVFAEAGASARPNACLSYECGGGWAMAGMPAMYGNGLTLTKVTVLALAGEQASVLKEHYFEGTYTSSRRVGSHVRTVLSGAYGPSGLQYWPEGGWGDESEMIDALEGQRLLATTMIQQSTLADWLPRRLERVGGSVSVAPTSCEDYYVPTIGTTSYGLTQIQAIDLGALDAPPVQTSVVGATDTIYSSTTSMVLAARSWDDPWLFEEPGDPISTTQTHLHKFDVGTDPAHPQWVASGSVPGTIHNQFSLDERDGLIRMSTTDTIASSDTWETHNNVFVLGDSNGQLAPVGSIRGIAPGEDIYATRFVGDRGYVVTFRQTDPLFVIDFSTPSSPLLLGALEIPGFSEYMHPIDDRHLLTVGRGGNEFGVDGTLALQIFDVSNGASPVLAHKYVFPGYGDSEAESNHKAFTYYAPLGMLAIPYQSYESSFHSTLELFRIDATTGITKVGSVDHAGFFDTYGGYCDGYYGTGVRRGLFIEDLVYSISYGGVRVNAVADLADVASLALPEPTYQGCYSYY